MQTSATDLHRRGEDGFTLVEMLVAIGVVSMMAGLALLASPGPERRTQAFVEQFAAFVVRGGEESVIANTPVALVLSREGYGFARRHEHGWSLITHGSSLAQRPWPDGVSYDVEDGDKSEAAAGRIAVFDVLGGADPARIRLSRAGRSWRVELDSGGNVHVDSLP